MTSIIAFIIAMIFGTANMNVQDIQQYNDSIKTYDVPTKGIGFGENGGSATTNPPSGRP